MTENRNPEKTLGARHLIAMFLTGVAVCGVFFALGFVVGYHERPPKSEFAAETVTEPSPAPPVVSRPAATLRSSAAESAEPAPLAKLAKPANSANLANHGESADPASAPPEPLSKLLAAPAIVTGTSPPPVSTSGGSQPAARGGAESPTASAASAETRAGYAVQVTALRTRQDAEGLVGVLKSRGYPVLLVSPEDAHVSDGLFRVQVGPFGNRSDAEKARARLAKEGLFKDLFIKH